MNKVKMVAVTRMIAAGAGLGSAFPGVGTVLGAGIGALAAGVVLVVAK